MLSLFHLIPERHGQTNGQTDRFAISISRVSVLTRDKNWMVNLGIWKEVAPGAILTKCRMWRDMADVITCAIFRDCRLRVVGVVRGVSLTWRVALTTLVTLPCDRVKVKKGKGLDTCYSATYISQTRDQQRFTIFTKCDRNLQSCTHRIVTDTNLNNFLWQWVAVNNIFNGQEQRAARCAAIFVDGCASYCLSNAMHGQNINLPVCVCVSVCLSVCVCPSHFLSTRIQVKHLNGFLQLIA